MTCADCEAEVAILHNRPGSVQRTICGQCQGKTNRKIVDQMRGAVSTLKHSVDPAEEREAIEALRRLSPDDADDVIRFISDRRAEGAYRGGGK